MNNKQDIHDINANKILETIINNPRFDILNRLLSEGTISVNTDREYAALDFYEERYLEETGNSSFVITIEAKDETENEFTIYCWDGVDGIHMNSIEEAVSAAESSISNIYWEWEQIDAENEF